VHFFLFLFVLGIRFTDPGNTSVKTGESAYEDAKSSNIQHTYTNHDIPGASAPESEDYDHLLNNSLNNNTETRPEPQTVRELKMLVGLVYLHLCG